LNWLAWWLFSLLLRNLLLCCFYWRLLFLWNLLNRFSWWFLSLRLVSIKARLTCFSLLLFCEGLWWRSWFHVIFISCISWLSWLRNRLRYCLLSNCLGGFLRWNTLLWFLNWRLWLFWLLRFLGYCLLLSLSWRFLCTWWLLLFSWRFFTWWFICSNLLLLLSIFLLLRWWLFLLSLLFGKDRLIWLFDLIL